MKAKLLLSIGASLLLGLTSCTNDMGMMDPNSVLNKGIKLVHAPDVNAWSGAQTLTAGSRSRVASRATDGIVSWNECFSTTIDRNKEAEFIESKLGEKVSNLDGIDFDFLFYSDEDATLEFYPVYSQTHTANSLGLFYFDEVGQRHEVIVWQDMNPYQLTTSEWVWDPDLNQSIEKKTSKGVQISIKAGYKFGFYWKGNVQQHDLEDGQWDTNVTYYSISELNPEVYITNGEGQKLGEEKTRVHAGTFDANGQTYLCIEDWTDCDYQDWVFTCNAVLKTVDSDNKLPGTPSVTEPEPEPEVCDQCGHEKHGENCPVCDENEEGGCYHEPAVEPEPETPVVPDPSEGDEILHNDEVEVNLSINDSHTDGSGAPKYAAADLWSKLSIHVRKGTDVKIVLPVGAAFTCASDDFAIIEKHLQDNMTWTGDAEAMFDEATNTLTYQIEDWTVTLTVTCTVNEITITTQGITQELIDYLFEKNGDGINFEVWTYFETEYVDENGVVKARENVSREDLRYRLNKATIEFLTDEPSYYINAFGEIEGERRIDDCAVSIIAAQLNGYYHYSFTGEHLNGTPYNEVYVKNGVTPDDAHVKHYTEPKAE